MERGETNKTAPSYHPISLYSLRVNTVVNFDMYMKLSERNRKWRFVLYRRKNIPFTERTRKNLTEHGTDELYIDLFDKREYQLYLENNLDAIIADEAVPIEEKSRIAYTCATGLVEELLENPRSGKHVQRSKAVVSNLVNYMLSESQAFFSLVVTTSFDYYTYTHSVNVAVFGIALAHRLGLYSLRELNTIGSGLIVHDLGKSLIDKRILNKRGPLNKEEWALIKEHPENGAKLLSASGHLSEEARVIVANHHEKLDGSGYPHRLRGNAIHPYARIATLADIFDALTTRRPYKLAEHSFPALQIMRDEMGQALDQKLFREFVLLLGAETHG
ncbi:MAG: HD-GYP domain-containing protein [Candidatus Hydrogenedentota bacterium]|nr:MAG: HD-GYP domain-containing protein [Candidatus Hydrogenedentota bacterium]